MQFIRKTALLLIVSMLLCLLPGCGVTVNHYDGDPLSAGHIEEEDSFSGEVTLKEYLDSGPKVGFLMSQDTAPDKNSYPAIFYFENGMAYGVSTWEYNKDYYIARNGSGYMYHVPVDQDLPIAMRNSGNNTAYRWYDDIGGFTWGDLSEMSEQELLEYAKEHKMWGHEYSLCIVTDKSGNRLEYETIRGATDGLNSLEVRFTGLTQADVYNATYSGIKTQSNNSGEFLALYFRTDGRFSIALDDVHTEGITVR